MLELGKIKNELVARRSFLEKKVDEMEGALRREHSANFSEQAHEREDDEVMERLELEAKNEIEAIKQAVERIETENYGVCTKCGEDISEKRLEILPYAGMCVNCAN
jgi:RNA polymerase-binding transcription factor